MNENGCEHHLARYGVPPPEKGNVRIREMNEINTIQHANGHSSFHRACRWCLYGWTAIAIGIAATHLFKMLPAYIMGGVLIMAGSIFCIISGSLSLLGLFIPGKTNRLLFLALGAVAYVSVVGLYLWSLL